jgi:hypothetical protein
MIQLSCHSLNPTEAKCLMQKSSPKIRFPFSDQERNRYDAYMRQADYFAGRWDSRREFEWKFSVSMWTLLVLGGGFLAGKGQRWDWTSFASILMHGQWFLILIPSVLHLEWLRGIWIANSYDKDSGRHFRDKAEAILTRVPLKPREPKKLENRPWYVAWYQSVCRTLADWSMRFQLLCTLFLSAVLVILTHIPLPPKACENERPEKHQYRTETVLANLRHYRADIPDVAGSHRPLLNSKLPVRDEALFRPSRF